ncbi:hypothetical protein BD410DRAFT_899253 [Rickenella mellea]|uniref:Uncharacterized protein n=1 Tax=Rickenella mellea TaxID=50990 RepID=A0A4Y7Q009_9AGAM|nr:hypothetical protein BD410DRAFT_899253 [Rickenella mellea]
MLRGYLEGLPPREWYQAQALKENELRRLQQLRALRPSGNRKAVVSSGKDKENITTGARPPKRTKDRMFRPPKALTALLPKRPPSIRILARKLYEESLAETISTLVSAEEDSVDFRADLPAVIPEVQHRMLHEDVDIQVAHLGTPNASTSTPSTSSGSQTLAQTIYTEGEATNFGSTQKSQGPSVDDPPIVGWDSPLTTAPPSPSQPPRPSEFDYELPVRLFKRLATHRRIVCRRKAYWSSDDESSGESDIEVLPADRGNTADGSRESRAVSPPQLHQGPAPSLNTIVEYQDPLVSSSHNPGDETASTNSLPPHQRSCAQATEREEHGAVDGPPLAHPTRPYPLSRQQLPRNPPSSPRFNTAVRDGTLRGSVTQLLHSVPGASVVAEHVRLSEDELEVVADILVGILLITNDACTTAEELVKRAKELEPSWKPSWFALALNAFNFLSLGESSDGTVLCRYEKHNDLDFTGRIGRYHQMHK